MSQVDEAVLSSDDRAAVERMLSAAWGAPQQLVAAEPASGRRHAVVLSDGARGSSVLEAASGAAGQRARHRRVCCRVGRPGVLLDERRCAHSETDRRRLGPAPPHHRRAARGQLVGRAADGRGPGRSDQSLDRLRGGSTRAPPREPRTLGALRSDRRGPRPRAEHRCGWPT